MIWFSYYRILGWEDGYCDHPKPRGPLGIMSEDIYCNGANELFSTCSETSQGDGGFEGYSIGLVVANMSHLQYALGEGYILVLDLYNSYSSFVIPVKFGPLKVISLYMLSHR